MVLGVMIVCSQFALAAPAQNNPIQALQARMQRLAQELNLTPDQKAKIKTIIASYRTEIRDIRQNTTLTPAQKKSQLHAIVKEISNQVKTTVLTAAQVQKLQQAKDALFSPRDRAIFSKLSLTADQKAQIEQIVAKYKPQVEAARQNTTLTAQQCRADVESIRKTAWGDIKALLTPAQLQQLEQMLSVLRRK
jgi:Spy/CpxP family protein refolding chaperone